MPPSEYPLPPLTHTTDHAAPAGSVPAVSGHQPTGRTGLQRTLRSPMPPSEYPPPSHTHHRPRCTSRVCPRCLWSPAGRPDRAPTDPQVTPCRPVSTLPTHTPPTTLHQQSLSPLSLVTSRPAGPGSNGPSGHPMPPSEYPSPHTHTPPDHAAPAGSVPAVSGHQPTGRTGLQRTLRSPHAAQ